MYSGASYYGDHIADSSNYSLYKATGEACAASNYSIEAVASQSHAAPFSSSGSATRTAECPVGSSLSFAFCPAATPVEPTATLVGSFHGLQAASRQQQQSNSLGLCGTAAAAAAAENPGTAAGTSEIHSRVAGAENSDRNDGVSKGNGGDKGIADVLFGRSSTVNEALLSLTSWNQDGSRQSSADPPLYSSAFQSLGFPSGGAADGNEKPAFVVGNAAIQESAGGVGEAGLPNAATLPGAVSGKGTADVSENQLQQAGHFLEEPKPMEPEGSAAGKVTSSGQTAENDAQGGAQAAFPASRDSSQPHTPQGALVCPAAGDPCRDSRQGHGRQQNQHDSHSRHLLPPISALLSEI
ncbi:hypothetical protein LPJ56_001675 [Coemansia sp. RSA 2599]|nr:hypothetical protein LPJ56_001675 [Coemansia sp. RSA 2599]